LLIIRSHPNPFHDTFSLNPFSNLLNKNDWRRRCFVQAKNQNNDLGEYSIFLTAQLTLRTDRNDNPNWVRQL
jgi:hypothetical protein